MRSVASPCIVAAVRSPESGSVVVRHAAALAARAGGSLHVVHAAPGAAHTTDRSLARRLELAVADTLGALPDERRPGDVHTRVVGGPSVPAAVLRYAADVRAALVVVGPAGRPSRGRLPEGTAAAFVARARCPILRLTEGPDGDGAVLVGLDFATQSLTALRAGAWLASLTGAPLDAVHVAPPAGPFGDLPPPTRLASDADAERAEATCRRMRHLAASLPLGAGPAAPLATPLRACLVGFGDPARGLLLAAATSRASILVVGTHGRSAGVTGLLGTTAARVLARAPVPVLVVPPRDGAALRPTLPLDAARAFRRTHAAPPA